MNTITRDTFYDRELICYQNKKGYRFSIDAMLIAHFVLHWKKAQVLDLGCGCGIIGLSLLYKIWDQIISINGLELQKTLADLAVRNIQANKYTEKFHIQEGDLRHIRSIYDPEQFTHVISNPPFFKSGSGGKV